jgi:hypothetical protein
MEIIYLIGFIWFICWLLGKFKSNTSGTNTPQSNTQSPYPRSTSGTNNPWSDSENTWRGAEQATVDTYRPSSRQSLPNKIIFPGSPDIQSAQSIDISNLHDAFTGAPIDARRPLWRCDHCKVYYHEDTLAFLRRENLSQCVSCTSNNIRLISNPSSHTSSGRDHHPSIVTIANYKNFLNKVVTFHGTVIKILHSRRGGDYAIMFEDKTWSSGFKLVIFKGSIRKVGGTRFLENLKGKNIKVRGLMKDHPRYGPSIIISERNMILGVH